MAGSVVLRRPEGVVPDGDWRGRQSRRHERDVSSAVSRMDSSRRNGITPTCTMPRSSFIGGWTPSVTTMRAKKSPLRRQAACRPDQIVGEGGRLVRRYLIGATENSANEAGLSPGERLAESVAFAVPTGIVTFAFLLLFTNQRSSPVVTPDESVNTRRT